MTKSFHIRMTQLAQALKVADSAFVRMKKSKDKNQQTLTNYELLITVLVPK
jgi:hypothetical protein